MIKRQYRDAIYMKHQFEPELIVPCVRWYITYRLSYRDLVAMMAERGVIITIAGVELAYRIHKRQFSLGRGRPRSDRSLRTDWEHAVA